MSESKKSKKMSIGDEVALIAGVASVGTFLYGLIGKKKSFDEAVNDAFWVGVSTGAGAGARRGAKALVDDIRDGTNLPTLEDNTEW